MGQGSDTARVAACARPQSEAPVVEEGEAIGGRQVAFVGEVVGRAGEGVDRGDVRPHRRRQQE
jgi:hypothetical protein